MEFVELSFIGFLFLFFLSLSLFFFFSMVSLLCYALLCYAMLLVWRCNAIPSKTNNSPCKGVKRCKE